MNTIAKVSHSEAESYLSCRRKHFYGYIKDGGLKATVTASGLARGSFVHEILEIFYKRILAEGDTTKAQRAVKHTALLDAWDYYLAAIKEGRFDDTPSTGRRSVKEMLFEFYFKNEPLVSNGWLIQAVELKIALEMELDDDTIYQYPFVVDLIAVDPAGKTVVIDHKCVYDFYSGEDTELLTQLPKYVGALRAGDFPADYAAYNMIRNRSKKDAAPEDVLRFLPVKPTTHQIEQVMSEQIAVAATIIDLRLGALSDADSMAFRSASTITCRNCDFRDICTTERVGGDISPALAVDFTTKDPDKPFEADFTIN